jgi:hypothetical protein
MTSIRDIIAIDTYIPLKWRLIIFKNYKDPLQLTEYSRSKLLAEMEITEIVLFDNTQDYLNIIIQQLRLGNLIVLNNGYYIGGLSQYGGVKPILTYSYETVGTKLMFFPQTIHSLNLLKKAGNSILPLGSALLRAVDVKYIIDYQNIKRLPTHNQFSQGTELKNWLHYSEKNIVDDQVIDDTRINAINSAGDYFSINNIYSQIKKSNFDLWIMPPIGNNLPKIIHHIWLIENTDMAIIEDKWKRNLKDPWVYRVWTPPEIDNLINATQWKYGYVKPNIKLWVVRMAILETYGGITIYGNYSANHLAPDILLASHISALYSGMDLSDIYYAASSKSQMQLNSRQLAELSRRPLEGVNEFFRQQKVGNKTTPIIDPDFYDRILRLTLLDTVTPKIIEAAIIENRSITIFPTNYLKPWLVHHTTLVSKPKNIAKIIHPYNYPIDAMIQHIQSDPMDRFRNL